MVSHKINVLVLGGLNTNCYLLYKDDTKEAVIIDPADEAEEIIRRITELSLIPKAVLLTHGHFDHILAVDSIRKHYKIQVYGHEAETDIIERGENNLSSLFRKDFTTQLDVLITDGQMIHAAGFPIKVIHTPGHTKGSVCYYLEEEKVLFSGDTIFAGSVGRTDFPSGSAGVLSRSVKNIFRQLTDDVEIYPGHGEQTSIGYEKIHNPYA